MVVSCATLETCTRIRLLRPPVHERTDIVTCGDPYIRWSESYERPRKLAAILAADIAGFSRLMGVDEVIK